MLGDSPCSNLLTTLATASEFRRSIDLSLKSQVAITERFESVQTFPAAGLCSMYSTVIRWWKQ